MLIIWADFIWHCFQILTKSWLLSVQSTNFIWHCFQILTKSWLLSVQSTTNSQLNFWCISFLQQFLRYLLIFGGFLLTLGLQKISASLWLVPELEPHCLLSITLMWCLRRVSRFLIFKYIEHFFSGYTKSSLF